MKNGKLEIDFRGHKEWKLEGEIHRTDGPAVIYASGTKSWFLKGLLHRLDGPAVILTSGTKEWWVNGIYYTEYEFNNRILTHWRRLFR